MSDEKHEDKRIETGRLRYVRLSGDHYINILKGGLVGDTVVTRLPDDSRYIRGGVDSLGAIYLVFESSQFTMLHEGDEIPYHGDIILKRNPVLRRIQ